MRLFEDLSNIVYEKLHQKNGFDENQRECITKIVNNAVEFVGLQILKESKDDNEVKSKIENVATNTAAFLALVILQLEFFGKSENNGPFFDLIEKALENEDNNDSRPPLKQ